MAEPLPPIAPGPGNGTPASAPAVLDRPDPAFEITGVQAVERAVTPTLRFTARATDESAIEIYTIALTVLFTIEPGKRSYDPEARERLVELFGEPERWASTTGAFRWAQVDKLVPSFTGSGEFEIDLPCTFDHEIAATKYLTGAADGVAPLRLHFNGTLFYKGTDERLQLMLLPWDRSVRFDLPIPTWRGMIDDHYPESAWVRLSEGTLRRLAERKGRNGSPTFDASIAEMLDATEGPGPTGASAGPVADGGGADA